MNYLKTDFSTNLSDECRAILDENGGLNCVLRGNSHRLDLEDNIQQRRWNRFVTSIGEKKIVASFKDDDDDDIKLNADNRYKFLAKAFMNDTSHNQQALS